MTGPTLTPGFGPDGHAELTTLADFDEGLLDAPHADRLNTHVNNCDQCRADLGRLRTTRALLSALPAAPMPDSVVRRIDAALDAAAASASVVPAAARRRWLTSPALAGVAAAVAAIGLASALIVSRTSGGSNAKSKEAAGAGAPTRPQAAAAGAAVKQWQTGANYTAANMATLVPGIVVGTPSPLPAPTAAASAQTLSGAKSNGASSSSYTQEQLRSVSSLTACAAILNDNTPVQPLAADYASFDGKPATIIVFPTHGNPRELDVWVVRSVCSSSAVDLAFYRVARPPSS